jgi:pimeloyl-ACP methyl ester carboxylesterase
MVLLHGFLDTWRTWDLVLPALEAKFEVFAPTLPGHAGGPALTAEPTTDALADQVERMLDGAGIDTAHLVGNSLGGYLVLQLAARGRAETVTALAPAGGWPASDPARFAAVDTLLAVHEQAKLIAPHVDAIVASPKTRKQATASIVVHSDHIPAELVAHQLLGVAACTGAHAFADAVKRHGWSDVIPARIDCPVRMVWGTEDLLLPWPIAAERYEHEWFPHADWVVMDDVGHCPQLDVPTEAAAVISGPVSFPG